jgi:hypothetical protein
MFRLLSLQLLNLPLPIFLHHVSLLSQGSRVQ